MEVLERGVGGGYTYIFVRVFVRMYYMCLCVVYMYNENMICMYVCMYVDMYVCMYVCICVWLYHVCIGWIWGV